MGKKSKQTASAEETTKSDKKRKVSSKNEDAGSAPSFSLFGGVKESELDDLFSKGSAYTIPTEKRVVSAPAEPIASSSKLPTELSSNTHSTSTKSKKRKISREQSDDDEEAEQPGVSQVVAATMAPAITEESGDEHDEDEDEDDEADEDEDEEEDEEEDGEAKLVHESLNPSKKRKEKTTSKPFVPADETAADRDRRTIFVGNLPIECAKSKSALHQLRAHLITFAPSAKVESVRFRSVPFATPTSGMPSENGEADDGKRSKREKERAAAWRAQQDVLKGNDEKAKEEVDKAKTFIDTKGRRKVAFIKKDFHAELGSCNAYVVFAYPHPDRPKNVAPILDPFEAASKALAADGTTFLGRTIRVDKVRLPSSVALEKATNALSKRDAWLPGGADPKSSVFVGGLDYAAKEEDVRVFFEELVKSERGPKESGERYVTGVRIIRDKETQLGKGFGYVHFADRETVDEVLAIDDKKLKFAKKPLRVQRCKTLPGASSKPTTNPKSTSGTGTDTRFSSSSSSAKPKPKSTHSVSIPKGDPKLGEKLKDLSKEERKLAKSSDADRQARRIAKKKSKLHSQVSRDNDKGSVKLGVTRSEKERVKSKKLAKAKKGKTRSAAAVAKMKGQR